MMHRIVMSLLVPMVAGSCLPDAIPSANLQNLVNPNGETYPVGLVIGAHTPSFAAQHLGAVLIQEVLGYNTTLSDGGLLNEAAYYAVAGCRTPTIMNDRGCLQNVTYYHVSFDSWSNQPVHWDQIQSTYTSMAPINKGNMGYSGFQGVYIPKAVQEEAYAQGLALEHYGNWNASSYQPWDFFDNITAIETSKLMACNEANDPNQVKDYVTVTGDVDGAVIVNEVYSRRCDDGYWWVSPACRSSPSNCVPWLTPGNGFWMYEAMQKFTTFHMPVAIGIAASYSEYMALPLAVNMAFYSFTLDQTFLQLAPVLVKFPPHNATEWQGISRTSQEQGTSIDTIVSHDLAELAPGVEKFADNLNMSEAQMIDILLDKRNTGDSWETVICRWVTANRATWQTWIPPESEWSECSPGYGLYDAVVKGSVEQRESATNRITCQVCPAGTFSQKIEDSKGETYICMACANGTSQPSTAALSCAPCKQGEYQDVLGSTECKPCTFGTYQDEEGQAECKSCPANTNTLGLGSIAPSNCSETAEGPLVVTVTLELTVDDAAAIKENPDVLNAMITSFAAKMGVDPSQVTLAFQDARRLDTRRLQTTLLAIFSVTTGSAAAAEQTGASIEAFSLAEISTAISTAATDAGYTGSLEVTGKAAVVPSTTATSSRTFTLTATSITTTATSSRTFTLTATSTTEEDESSSASDDHSTLIIGLVAGVLGVLAL